MDLELDIALIANAGLESHRVLFTIYAPTPCSLKDGVASISIYNHYNN